MINNQVPPHSKDAEIAVLGGLLLDKRAILNVLGILKYEDFYDFKHQLIYKAISELHDQSIPVDIITLNDNLTKSSMLEKAGGTYYLTEINAKTPSAANIEHHSRIVAEKSLKRQIIQMAGLAMTESYNEDSDALEQISTWRSKIIDLAVGIQSGTSFNTQQIIDNHRDYTDRLKRGEIRKTPIYLSGLRGYLGYFSDSDFIIIAGRPSMGKTAFMLNFVDDWILNYDMPVGIISLEMTALSLANRLIALNTGISTSSLKNDILETSDYKKIDGYFNVLKNRKLFIDETSGLTELQICTIAQRWKEQHDIKVLCIDYLQLIRSSEKGLNLEQTTARISQTLKFLAKELRIPVICLSQLNRKSEERADRRPSTADLRGSGSLEQDGDEILFIHNPNKAKIYKYEDGTSTKGTAEIIIAKNKDGATGTTRVAFIDHLTKFMDLADEIPENSIRNYAPVEHFQETEKDVEF